MTNLSRALISAVLLGVLWLFGGMLNTLNTVALGKIATMQFDQSDQSYLLWKAAGSTLAILPMVVSIGVVLCLLLLWWGPAKSAFQRFVNTTPVVFFLALAATVALLPGKVFAYADKTDITEAYTILPNESAFWIPDTGDNKSSQVQLESIDYLNSRKLAVKRFVVPHAKLGGSGGYLAWDYYVPTGRLIIADRTPYSSEWVDAGDRGSSSKKEGLHCQSKEGLDVTLGVGISASIAEKDAATYLYHFGVKPPEGKRSDIQTIFASVYYSRSVREVMDDFGRKKVQEVLCDLVSERNLEAVNAEAKLIKNTASKTVTEYMANYGITINFIGWADTFEFKPEIQAALDKRFSAEKERQAYEALAPYADTILKLAQAKFLITFAEKGDGKLPTTVVGETPDILKMLGIGGMPNTKSVVPPASPK